jgi:hypothetical protein
LKRVLILVGIVVFVMFIAALALPVKDRCGAPRYACATAPDAQGNIDYYYEVKPLAAIIIELFTNQKFPFYYTSGHEKVHYGP